MVQISERKNNDLRQVSLKEESPCSDCDLLVMHDLHVSVFSERIRAEKEGGIDDRRNREQNSSRSQQCSTALSELTTDALY